MGNRCYVAQVDKENKKIEMFYNHWNGAWYKTFKNGVGIGEIIPKKHILLEVKKFSNE